MDDSKYEVMEQRPLAEEYVALKSAVGWGDTPLDIAGGALDGSLFCVCIRHDGELVGFGRVIGDGVYAFYIQDIIVHPDHQRKGLGKAVMNRIMDYIDSAGGAEPYVGLMAAKGAVGFYEQFGFAERPNEAPGMQRWPRTRRDRPS